MKDIITKALAFDELKRRLNDPDIADNPYSQLISLFLTDAIQKAEKRTQGLTLDRITAEQLIQLAGPKDENIY